VAYFTDAEEVYRFLGGLLSDLHHDEALAPKLRRANTIVQYRLSEPDAVITSRLVEGEPHQVDCGETALDPEVVLTMSADVAHRFWLGKVSPTIALSKGQMKAKGPVAKILRLVPLVKPAFPRYVRMLEEAGRDDLLGPIR
jgi:hypothetical protein